MKRILLSLFVFISVNAVAQQKGINYQAVILNSKNIAAPGADISNTPLANKNICMLFEVLDGASGVEYQESVQTNTDAFGMVNLTIGNGNKTGGYAATFNKINWALGNKRMVVKVNVTGTCASYTEISNQPLTYVPFALYAENANVNDNTITTVKLADGAVTDVKVAPGISKSKVGLGNVDNTSDADKPISNATKAALDTKENNLNKSIATSLGNSDLLYPTQNAVKTYVDAKINNASVVDADANTKGKIQLAGDLAGTAGAPTVPALANKVDKITGKGLSSEDYTATEKTKLAAIIGTNTGDQTTITGNAGSATNLQGGVSGSIPYQTAVNTTIFLPKGTDGQVLTLASGLPSWATASSSGVPYTGATRAVDLGAYDLKVNGITAGKGGGADNSNTAFGIVALRANTTGTNNTANGNGSLSRNTTGSRNTAIGTISLLSNTTGSDNTSTGERSLLANTTGNQNTAFGDNTLNVNSTGSNNTALGFNANVAYNNLTNATAIGADAVVNASNEIQLGSIDITSVKTNGTLTAGAVTYPRTHGTSGQVLSTNGSGTLAWTTPSSSSFSVNTISTTSNVNGATINAGVLKLTPADATNGGVVTTTAQSFAGNKTILGTLNVSTVNSNEAPDVSNFTRLFFGTTGAVQWQSFTAGVTGALTKITVYGGAPSAARNGTLNIYAGTGNAGARLSTQSVALHTINGDHDLVLTTPLNILTGQVYTFEILDPATFPNYGTAARIAGSSYFATGYGTNPSASGIGYGIAFKTFAGGVSGGSITSAGMITAGAVTYPSTHGISGQVLSTNGSGTLAWTTPASGSTGVPYTGATGAVDLGGYDLKVNGITAGKGNGTPVGPPGISNSNTAFGVSALNANTNGNFNTANGFNSLTANTTGVLNTAIGISSLESNTTGNSNTSNGGNALRSNTTGVANTASGAYSLSENTTGNFNTASGVNSLFGNTTGVENTATGFGALRSNTTGGGNVAIGVSSLSANTTGFSNTATGNYSLNANNTGSENTANGSGALNNNTTGSNNTAIGFTTLESNTTGFNNTATGSGSLYSNTTGRLNTANGVNSLYKNTTGVQNTASGSEALLENTTGFNNTANGAYSLHKNTTGNFSTANGVNALYQNTTGGSNTANGFNALNLNTTGSYNTASGVKSLYKNTTGVQNTASGYEALLENTTGIRNTANGNASLYYNTTGSNNTANGNASLYYNTTGSNNTGIGNGSLLFNGAGINNTAIGYNSLSLNSTGDENTALGFGADVGANNLTNATVIGANAIVNASNEMQLGNFNVTSIRTAGAYFGSAFTVSSDKRLKHNISPIQFGLSSVMQLNPVSYDKKNTLEAKEYAIKENGFIAQELQKIMPYLVNEGTDKDKLLSVNYTALIPVLTKAIQEQQKLIEEQQKQIEDLNKKMAQVLELLNTKK